MFFVKYFLLESGFTGNLFNLGRMREVRGRAGKVGFQHFNPTYCSSKNMTAFGIPCIASIRILVSIIPFVCGVAAISHAPFSAMPHCHASPPYLPTFQNKVGSQRFSISDQQSAISHQRTRLETSPAGSG